MNRDAAIEAIRRLHQPTTAWWWRYLVHPYGLPKCRECAQPWPCDTYEATETA